MPPGSLDPLRIPPEFWQRVDVSNALQRRDIGSLFRLVRQHTGASQTRIGIAVGMPQSQISLIMSTGHRQRRVTAHDVLARIVDGLDAPDHARARLGLAARDSTLAEHPGSAFRTEAPESGDPPWALAEAITRSSVSPHTMQCLERITLAQVTRYPSTPPAEMWPIVRQQLAHVAHALAQRQTLRIQRRLTRTAGMLAGLAGNLLVDLGHRLQAHAYFEVSRLAGDEACDDDLAAWALSMQSIEPYFDGNPRDSIALLDQAARRGPALSARRRSWIAALIARAHAANGDASCALAHLDDAYAAMRDADPPHGTDFFDEHRLDGLAGTVHMRLRATARASDLIAQAIASRPSSDAKGRALLTLDRAECATIDKDPDSACDLIHEALDIAEGQIVHPIVVRVRQIRASVRDLSRTAASSRLDERLRVVLAEPVKGI